ncbi:GGDEF domain-containing protein [Paenibacillus ginsengarvi]|uniref:GGDEF domain-containing protein n=1 Tax=Paenibacillus ginsengarvi TaxID=400777 RepID=A0A3B0CJ90_9BACL|nr:GGDEF domain-containing protein [Paenibacillus ginsengarvi]RKN85463.1 GGDEF domain-containing protein [Paenibacillus ginsengarvi]
MAMLGLNKMELEWISHKLDQGVAGLLVLDIARLYELEKAGGASYGQRIIASVKEAAEASLPEWPNVFMCKMAGDDMYFFIAMEPGVRDAGLHVHETGMQIKLRLERRLSDGLGAAAPVFRMGCSLLRSQQPRKPIATVVYDAVKQALREMKHEPAGGGLAARGDRGERFLAILQNQSLYAVYQPIVSLADGSVFGYESLSRGPQHSGFVSPLELFKFAEEEGFLYTLDRLAREKAIAGCGELRKEQRVFINVPAQVIHDPHFTPGRTLRLLERRGLSPHNVVFEITERSSIEDFSTAKKILQHYRSQGYQIAIDDAGAGYSSLQAIAELQPDYIKVDRSLIRNIHKDKIKEHMLETFVTFADKMNIRIIAEGIEQADELYKLMQMGIHFGQGFLLAKPSPKLSGLEPRQIDQIRLRRRLREVGGFPPVGTIAAPVREFSPDTPISEAARFFKENENGLAAVVVQDGEPVGLVMREKLFQQLAGQYGIPLYWKRPIKQLMDPSPLIVDEHLPLDQVSQMSTAREANNLYDYVIITSAGRYAGVASVRSILESITKVRVEQARIANPLTGLPGNLQIQRELNMRIMAERKFSVIYADLDFFKWYNDRFGFQKGDELIQFTAGILLEACRGRGEADDFVGHIGGDDFIVLSGAAAPDKLCEDIIRRFDQGVSAFMDADGPVSVFDREGNLVDADRVNISLSLIVCECSPNITAEYISMTAAKLKKRAKAHIGSVYYSERIELAPDAL